MYDGKKMVSPSRRYVAICRDHKLDGTIEFRFRWFRLPECLPEPAGEPMQNNADDASWYYLNRIDFSSCIDGVYPYEDFKNLKKAWTGKFRKFFVLRLFRLKFEKIWRWDWSNNPSKTMPCLHVYMKYIGLQIGIDLVKFPW